MQNQENSNIFYGGFFVRLAAAWVDAFLVACALIGFRMPVWLNGGNGSFLYQPVLFQFTPWDILLYLLGTSYYVFFTYAAGATLGKRMFSLRVVSADGKRLTLFDVLYRETIGKYLSGAFLCVGYLMAGVDREKRALHDMLSDTRVVYAFGGQPAFTEPVPKSYQDIEAYYKRSTEEKYQAADYGYQKPETKVEESLEEPEDTTCDSEN